MRKRERSTIQATKGLYLELKKQADLRNVKISDLIDQMIIAQLGQWFKENK